MSGAALQHEPFDVDDPHPFQVVLGGVAFAAARQRELTRQEQECDIACRRVREHEPVGVVRDVAHRCRFEFDDCSSLFGVIALQDEQRVSWVSTLSPIRSDAAAL